MKILAIALNTFRGVIRDKIFYTLLFFAVLMVVSSIMLSSLGSTAGNKVLADISLSAISIFGVIISVFVGINLVQNEIDRKTIYTIISKPISRPAFLAGKYLGLALTLFAYTALMAACFLVIMFINTGSWAVGMMPAVLLTYLEFLVLVATAMTFSTFSTPVLSAAYTIAVFVIGHLTPDIMLLADKHRDEYSGTALKVLYYVLPNLENFNIRTEAVHGINVPASFIAGSLAYGLLYSALLLAVAVMVFQKKDFK